jgi:hypothetical protein
MLDGITTGKPGPAERQRRSIPSYEPINVAVSAVLGATFAYILCQGTLNATDWNLEALSEEAFIIFLVAIGMVKFVEPLIERWRNALDLSASDPAAHLERPWRIRLIAFAVLVVASVLHSILHNSIKNFVVARPTFWLSADEVMSSLLMPVVITWFWIRGARQHPSKAAVRGVLGGVLVGVLFSVLWVILEGGWRVTVPLGWALQPAILGLAGGVVVDRGWGPRASLSAATALLVVLLLFDGIRMTLGSVKLSVVIGDLSCVAGWGIGLIIYPLADVLLRTNCDPAPRMASSG